MIKRSSKSAQQPFQSNIISPFIAHLNSSHNATWVHSGCNIYCVTPNVVPEEIKIFWKLHSSERKSEIKLSSKMSKRKYLTEAFEHQLRQQSPDHDSIRCAIESVESFLDWFDRVRTSKPAQIQPPRWHYVLRYGVHPVNKRKRARKEKKIQEIKRGKKQKWVNVAIRNR